MHAFLIDPFNNTVTEVPYDGDYNSIYKHITTPVKQVDMFECVQVNNQDDTIFVDEEGLLMDMSQQKFFTFKGQPLAGRGLVLGTNDEGESISPKISIEDLTKEVQFTTLQSLRKKFK